MGGGDGRRQRHLPPNAQDAHLLHATVAKAMMLASSSVSFSSYPTTPLRKVLNSTQADSLLTSKNYLAKGHRRNDCFCSVSAPYWQTPRERMSQTARCTLASEALMPSFHLELLLVLLNLAPITYNAKLRATNRR